MTGKREIDLVRQEIGRGNREPQTPRILEFGDLFLQYNAHVFDYLTHLARCHMRVMDEKLIDVNQP